VIEWLSSSSGIINLKPLCLRKFLDVAMDGKLLRASIPNTPT
jgi:hypothetical protein